MPSSDWKEVEVSLPPEILESAGVITDITGLLSGFLQILKGLAETILAIIPQEINFRTQALITLVETAEAALEDLFEDNGAYVLAVPIAKPVPEEFRKYIPQLSLTARQSEILSRQRFPEETASGELGFVADPEGYSRYVADLATSYAINTYIQAVNSNVGGNFGFIRAVVASLDDEFDESRPKFDNPSDHILAAILLMGADDAVNLVPSAKKLINLLRIVPPGFADRASLPLPQGVKAILGFPTTDGRYQAVISWDAPKLSQQITSIFANSDIKIKRFAVIKSTNSDIMRADTVVDLFGTSDVSFGLSSRDHRVIYENEYTGSNSYVDELGVEFGVRTYYSVAFQYEIDGVIQPYNEISSARTVLFYPTIPAISGIPPDWIRTPTVLDAIPVLNDLIRLLKAKFDQFKNFETSASNVLQAYVDFLNFEIARVAAVAEEIDAIVSSVVETFTPPEAGLYFKTIETTGGNDGFVFELLDSFSDTSDPGRPPFDEGDEAVFGFVFLAGASSKEKLAGLKTTFDILFGSPSGALTPLQEALQGIDEAIVALAEEELGLAEE